MNSGEASTSNATQTTIWAKLVPTDSRLPHVDIKLNETVISSSTSCSSSDCQSWCRVTRMKDLNAVTIRNLSSSVILVDGTCLEKEEDLVIRCGSEIVSGPQREGHVVYTLQLIKEDECSNNLLKIKFDVEHVKCSICLNVWHDVVTLNPCLHNFCNGCFSRWMKTLLSTRQALLCPQCRATVQSVGRNHFLNYLEKAILESDSSLKRSDEEIALLDSLAAVKANFVIKSKRRRNQDGHDSLPNRDISPGFSQCLQCAGQAGNQYGGFRCNEDTIHLQCHGCGHMMPSRPDSNIPQYCLGCSRSFCGAYWQSQGVANQISSGLCSTETFLPISDRAISRIPVCTHQGNRHEQSITERYIAQSGATLNDVISSWSAKMDHRELDPVPSIYQADRISSTTHLCNGCSDKVVGHLLQSYRLTIPKQFLSTDASSREDCWYGWACRTQHHNDDHARKRNHMCRPTRGYSSP